MGGGGGQTESLQLIARRWALYVIFIVQLMRPRASSDWLGWWWIAYSLAQIHGVYWVADLMNKYTEATSYKNLPHCDTNKKGSYRLIGLERWVFQYLLRKSIISVSQTWIRGMGHEVHYNPSTKFMLNIYCEY